MPVGSGRIRDYGYATTKENPVNPIESSNSNKGILELLKQLLGQKGAPRELADVIAALEAGAGTANVVHTSNMAQAQRLSRDPFTYARDAVGRPTRGFVVPTGTSGGYVVTPGGKTADIGRALNQKGEPELPGQAAPDMQLAETIKNFRARRRMMDKIRRFYA